MQAEQIFDELAAHRRQDPACADLLQYRRKATAHQYLRLYRLIDRYLPDRAEVLDWGCGNGHVSYGLCRLGHRVTGYSFDDFGLRRHIPAGYRFVQAAADDPAGLPFEEASFDAVLSVGVLEHVRETGGNEEASLREIARVLRPGGVFVCYHLPNRYSLIEAVTRRLPRAHSHLYRYTAADIRRLAGGAGMEIVEIGRYAALPRNMWHRAPERLGDAGWAVKAWDVLDGVMGKVLSPVCQNYFFVARKPGRSRG